MTLSSHCLKLCLSLALSTPALSFAASGDLPPDARQRCWRGDQLLKAAERDGFRVQAEASSEAPSTKGAHVYIVLNDSLRSIGIIGSASVDGIPTQCDWGVGTEWRPSPTQDPVGWSSAEPVNKSLKTCRPLPELLRRLEATSSEVAYGRVSRGPVIDLLITRSVRSGSWSLFLVDKRGSEEVACFSNWGRDFRVPGESGAIRSASLR